MPVFVIEIVFLFCICYLVLPIYHWVIEKVFYLTGFMFIVDSNVERVVKNPWIIATVLLLLLVSGLLFLMEQITVLTFADTREQFPVKEWLNSLKRIFTAPGLLLMFFSFFSSLVFHPLYLLLLIQNFRIVELLKSEVFVGEGGNITLVIILIMILLVGLFLLFVDYEYFVRKYTIKEAFANSINRIRKKLLPISFNIITFHFIIIVIVALCYLAFMFIAFLVLKNSDYYSLRYAQWLTIMDVFNRSILYFYSVGALTINFVMVTVVSSETIGSTIHVKGKKLRTTKKGWKSEKKAWYGFLLLSIFIIYVFTHKNLFMGVRLQLGYETGLEQPEIIAHRGNSSITPENTLVSVQSAIDAQADRTEIDVQLTKDGVLVLMHDNTLRRTCNRNGKVSDYNYKELSEMDAGSWFSDAYANERIPSLEQVLELSKDKINLLIEFKSITGREEEYAKAIVQLVNDFGVKQQVIISSFHLEELEEIKKLDSGIVTCLISRVAYGPLDEHESIDTISINSNFAGSRTIQMFDNRGYSLYVWTVNDKREIENMEELRVSGIITDYPIKAREILYEDSVPDFIAQVVDNMFRIFR
jgi:glycerophosphoryl diester phosphodiesterase